MRPGHPSTQAQAKSAGPSLFPFVAHDVVARKAREALRASVEPHDGLLPIDLELVNNA